MSEFSSVDTINLSLDRQERTYSLVREWVAETEDRAQQMAGELEAEYGDTDSAESYTDYQIAVDDTTVRLTLESEWAADGEDRVYIGAIAATVGELYSVVHDASCEAVEEIAWMHYQDVTHDE